ncbi:hypothetical protein PSQ90_11965 [Devosia rhodophyticola]|uniref:Uncharacterized protein n=1 Tax=Devosia rhodophyticola TaxID=3026423 RepID=A0ABY7YUL8_9HYPH|nr:hypothetical protein [Devosia rhodophyticola]WDR05006.1 hypothetical protein PSQ90_11965 [Devosia rhodophyticola]
MMTQSRIASIALSNRPSMTSMIQGYDGQIHYGYLLMGLVPALALLSAATAMLLVIG